MKSPFNHNFCRLKPQCYLGRWTAASSWVRGPASWMRIRSWQAGKFRSKTEVQWENHLSMLDVSKVLVWNVSCSTSDSVNSTNSALRDLSFACSKRQCEAATSRILATSANKCCKTWCKSREISSGCPEKFLVKSSAAQGRWPRAVSFQIGLALA